MIGFVDLVGMIKLNRRIMLSDCCDELVVELLKPYPDDVVRDFYLGNVDFVVGYWLNDGRLGEMVIVEPEVGLKGEEVV